MTYLSYNDFKQESVKQFISIEVNYSDETVSMIAGMIMMLK